MARAVGLAILALAAVLAAPAGRAAEATRPLISSDVFWNNCAGSPAPDSPAYTFCSVYITGLTDGYIASLQLLGQPGLCLHASDMDSFVKSVIAAMPVSQNGKEPIAPEALGAIRSVMTCE